MAKKTLFITGARADYGLLKPVIGTMLKSRKLEPKILVTGIHTLKKFGSTVNEIVRDQLPIASVVKISETDSMLECLNKEIDGIDKYCSSNKPDYIFVLGDRDEAFAGAVAGLHLNIPVIHFSGGDVSGPSVDHYLRNAITIFSKFHFVQTQQSRKNVIRLGADPKLTFIVGSLGLDNLEPSGIENKEQVAKKMGLDKNKQWFLISMHPTLFDSHPIRSQIDPLIDLLKKLKGEKIIIYPNTDTGSAYFIKKINSIKKQRNAHVFANLARPVFLQLLKNCDVFVGNSSSGLTEAGFLKIPFVNIGNRQRGREFGANVVPANYDEKSISSTIKTALSDKFNRKIKKSKPCYKGGRVAERVVSILEKLV